MLRYSAARDLGRREAGFQLQVSEDAQSVAIRVIGALDIETAPALEARMLPVRPAVRRIVVDLREADYLESGGVKVLFALQEQLDDQEGNIRVLVRPGSPAERKIRLLRLAERFDLRQG